MEAIPEDPNYDFRKETLKEFCSTLT